MATGGAAGEPFSLPSGFFGTEEGASPMALTQERTYRSERIWTPRPPLDPGLRRRFHGPIQPMEEPTFLERLFGRH
ncbi:hypothetical protein ADT71_24950 [Novosphingobium sp. ST904]|nr:hypothetical protein ADT71_24950 [Novosphingobium sp. ST904]